jgi:predicted Zn-dependent protease with MMP-like domain
MTFEQFAARAHEVFDEIPAAYKEGVDGIEVSRRTVLHPTLPDVFTLGECLSEHYPSAFGGGEIRSIVYLYYGSFLELSRQDDDWDWEEEIFETITHEIRHHLEHLADDDTLIDADIADDHNFARREGEPFDPAFYRGGTLIAPDLYEVSGDVFLEVAGAAAAGTVISIDVEGEKRRITAPTGPADVHFLRLEEPPIECRGDFYVVVVRPRNGVRRLVDLLRGRSPMVAESDAEPLESPSIGGA